jgi:hypothetical protein
MKAMKSIQICFLLIYFLYSNLTRIYAEQRVNGVIGDISYTEKFGQNPNPKSNEKIRIQTHLKYVEKLLRSKNTTNLSITQKKNRLKMLDLLSNYIKAGVFPKNYDFSNQRIPCFIDKKGNICAVGYLIEQTAGRKVAEKINSKFKYEYLNAMNDQTIDQWIKLSGLTKTECAMIQPTYGPAPTENYIKQAYGISSSLVCGLNLSLNTINGIQISKGANNKFIPILGLISGAGQITLGAINYPKLQTSWNGTYVNASQRNLSLLNIGLGTSSLILSSWNLITNRQVKEKPYSWNIYTFPTTARNVGIGFQFTKRF